MLNEITSVPGTHPSHRVFARQAFVSRLYDWVLGRCYDLFMDICAPGYRWTITTFYGRYLDSIEGVSRILEVGPGTGYVTLVVSKKLATADITCLDISSRMLTQLRKRLLRAHVARMPQLVQGDITRPTGLPDNSCQLVLAQSMIEHLPDISPALAEFHRVLAPGGTLLVSDICDGFFGRLFAIVCQVRSFTKPQMRQAAEAAGFDSLEFLDYQASFFMRGTLFFLQARKPIVADASRPGTRLQNDSSDAR